MTSQRQNDIVFADVSSLFPRKLLKIISLIGRSSDLLPFLNAFPKISYQLLVISLFKTVHYFLFSEKSVAKVLFKTFKELTAAGLCRIYTCFPFNPNGGYTK